MRPRSQGLSGPHEGSDGPHGVPLYPGMIPSGLEWTGAMSSARRSSVRAPFLGGLGSWFRAVLFSLLMFTSKIPIMGISLSFAGGAPRPHRAKKPHKS
jgi:hypothetical protein